MGEGERREGVGVSCCDVYLLSSLPKVSHCEGITVNTSVAEFSQPPEGACAGCCQKMHVRKCVCGPRPLTDAAVGAEIEEDILRAQPLQQVDQRPCGDGWEVRARPGVVRLELLAEGKVPSRGQRLEQRGEVRAEG